MDMGYYDYNFALGNRLKELRARSGMTIEKISEITNVSPRTVSNWENGMTTPRIRLFHQHLDSLKVSDSERIELVQLAYGKR